MFESISRFGRPAADPRNPEDWLRHQAAGAASAQAHLSRLGAAWVFAGLVPLRFSLSAEPGRKN